MSRGPQLRLEQENEVRLKSRSHTPVKNRQGVRTQSGKTIILEVASTETVESAKHKIAMLDGLPVYHQRLVYNRNTRK